MYSRTNQSLFELIKSNNRNSYNNSSKLKNYSKNSITLCHGICPLIQINNTNK